MIHATFHRLMRTAIVAAIVCAVTVSGAGTARGDPSRDAIFWQFLQQYGLAYPFATQAIAVAFGKGTRDTFGQGYSYAAIVSDITKDTGLTSQQAGQFIGLSLGAYCRQYRDWIPAGIG